MILEDKSEVDCILNLAGLLHGITTTALGQAALRVREVVRDYGRGPEVHSPSSLHSKASWIEIPRG